MRLGVRLFSSAWSAISVRSRNHAAPVQPPPVHGYVSQSPGSRGHVVRGLVWALVSLALGSAPAAVLAESLGKTQIVRGAESTGAVGPRRIDIDLRKLPKARPWRPGDPPGR